MSSSLAQKITLKNLLVFTFPSIVMMVFMSLYTIVDGIFVAKLIGTDAFSAVNIVYPLNSLIIALGTMFGTGGTAIIVKKIGEKKEQQAREIFSFLMIFSIVISLIIVGFSIVFLEQIIYLLGSNQEIFGYCYDYAFYLILFFPANILQLQFQCLFVADGRPNIGLGITILGGLMNVVLDYVFIAIFDMGISGAAIATGIGYAVTAVYGLVYFLFNRKREIYFVKLKADWASLVHAVLNGSSEMVNNLSASITTFLFNIIMMKYLGQNGVAAISIVLYFDFILIAINLGYSMGVAPLISYNYGSQNHQKLKNIVKMSLKTSTMLGVVTLAVAVMFAPQLSAIFAEKGSEVYQLTVTGLRIYAISYLFKGINIFSSAMFTAFSDGALSALISFARSLLFLVPSIFGLSYLLGINGLWFAVPAAELLTVVVSIVCLIKYRSKYQYA